MITQLQSGSSWSPMQGSTVMSSNQPDCSWAGSLPCIDLSDGGEAAGQKYGGMKRKGWQLLLLWRHLLLVSHLGEEAEGQAVVASVEAPGA